MDYIDFAISRLRSLLSTIEQLRLSEFPYVDSRIAFDKMEREVSRSTTFMEELKSGGNLISEENKKQYALGALNTVAAYLPYLGLILRSTNVRNAFEIFQPLLRLAGELLDDSKTESGRKIHLVISSEWSYSPYVYTQPISSLNDFILIGLPATEAANPLLIPLAGHELGHMIWNAEKNDIKIREEVNRRIDGRLEENKSEYKKSLLNDISRRDKKALIYGMVIDQAMEVFCDIIGTRIFGSAFPLSLCYLISPGLPRSERYPSNTTRLKFIHNAEKRFFTEPMIAVDYFSFLDDEQNNGGPELQMADSIVEEIFDTLVDLASSFISNKYKFLNKGKRKDEKKSLPSPDKEKVDAIYTSFEQVIPAEGAEQLSNIINAGWRACLKKDLWANIQAINEDNSNPILMDLILKNIELLEYEEKTKWVSGKC